MLLVVWVYLTNKIQLHKVVLGQGRSYLAFAPDWSYFGHQQDKSCVVIFCGFSNVYQIFTEEFQVGITSRTEESSPQQLSIPMWAYLWTSILFECKQVRPWREIATQCFHTKARLKEQRAVRRRLREYKKLCSYGSFPGKSLSGVQVSRSSSCKVSKRREHTSLTPLFFQCFESVNILIGIDPEGQRAATVSRQGRTAAAVVQARNYGMVTMFAQVALLPLIFRVDAHFPRICRRHDATPPPSR